MKKIEEKERNAKKIKLNYRKEIMKLIEVGIISNIIIKY